MNIYSLRYVYDKIVNGKTINMYIRIDRRNYRGYHILPYPIERSVKIGSFAIEYKGTMFINLEEYKNIMKSNLDILFTNNKGGKFLYNQLGKQIKNKRWVPNILNGTISDDDYIHRSIIEKKWVDIRSDRYGIIRIAIYKTPIVYKMFIDNVLSMMGHLRKNNIKTYQVILSNSHSISYIVNINNE
ncbi:hypothetical protein [Candidatus Vidania fulgoroideorum]